MKVVEFSSGYLLLNQVDPACRFYLKKDSLLGFVQQANVASVGIDNEHVVKLWVKNDTLKCAVNGTENNIARSVTRFY